MALETLYKAWTKVEVPTYSEEELASIFSIKQTNVLANLKSVLKFDLLISMVLIFAFMTLLSVLNFRTSNFWSTLMAFMGLQHLTIYLLQVLLINKRSRFSSNVLSSLAHSIRDLKRLQFFYRTIPVLLTLTLYMIYYLWFGIALSTIELLGTVILTCTVVSLLSEFLSSKLIRQRIKELTKLKEACEKVN